MQFVPRNTHHPSRADANLNLHIVAAAMSDFYCGHVCAELCSMRNLAATCDERVATVSP
jgi:hypothetical protein